LRRELPAFCQRREARIILAGVDVIRKIPEVGKSPSMANAVPEPETLTNPIAKLL
jgi:hypothetical protein